MPIKEVCEPNLMHGLADGFGKRMTELFSRPSEL
jgi:hypothetical protein